MSLPRFLFKQSLRTDFSIHNLPYGVFRAPGQQPHIGVAIGDKILDLHVLSQKGRVHSSLVDSTLNAFMGLDSSVWRTTRERVLEMLSDDHPNSLKNDVSLIKAAVVDQNAVEMVLPVTIGDYTDFYASECHASNVGRIFRPNQEPLLPNWKHMPVGYHGRASSVVVSGREIKRPKGQLKRILSSGETDIQFGASEKLDFETEIGMFIGGAENSLGSPISVDEAVAKRIFGFTLLNDWSARDIQLWEYVPLGPFLSKNFATTISPWIVTMDAMRPFMVPPTGATKQAHPKPLPYLLSDRDFSLDISIRTALNGTTVSSTNAKYLYWSFGQMVAHHSVNGCNLRPGDLLGSGTISGPGKSELGSLLELTWNGRDPVDTGKGKRTFLQNGDNVEMTAKCETANGTVSIGFGQCIGTIVE